MIDPIDFPPISYSNYLMIMRIKFPILLIVLNFSLGCASSYIQSIGGDTNQSFERVYTTDWNIAWQATLEALKHTQIDTSNQEAGYVQTKWIDNTAEKNFIDSFGEADKYLKAQYRFQISLHKGYFKRKPTIKIRIQKEQLIQKDALEGWRPAETDSIEENTLLYRIGRLISMMTKLNQLEEQRTQRELQNPH
jgi:hypothetical protein